MTNERGQLIVISGPSGVGKGTVIKELFKLRDNFAFSVSMTTRAPRDGEVDGKDYHFVDKAYFQELVENDAFLEYAQYGTGDGYGTPRAPIDAWLAEGKNVVLDIEVQGAMQVKAKRPDTIMIFLVPPSMEELERRLRKRGTETEDKIQKRLATAKIEIPKAKDYEYIIVHDGPPRSANLIMNIIIAEQCKAEKHLHVLEV